MIRNLKALGLALVAVFAMGAVTASAASAQAVFDWDDGTTYLTGFAESAANGGTQVFTTSVGKVECNEVKASAHVTGTSAETVTTTSITYNDTSKGEDKCKGPLGTSPKIEMNGCNYRFIAGTTIAGNEHDTIGTVDILCSEGKKIVINAPGCVIKVGPQEGLGPVFYKTITGPGPEHITIEPKIGDGGEHNKAISYTTEGFLCGISTKTNGTYTGNVTVLGETFEGKQTSARVT